MNKINLLKLLFTQHKYSEKGISLIELLVAIIMGGIVLTAATSAFANLLRANQSVENKSLRGVGLTKALAIIQEDIKGARAVTRTISACSGATSASCLLLTYPTQGIIDQETCNPGKLLNINEYIQSIQYAYEDITGGIQIYLKPGVLKRKIFCQNGTVGKWITVADGLISINENNPNPSCNKDLPNWTGNATVYGDNGGGKGGFRFCLNTDDTDPNTAPNNRLVRVFLYGHIVGGNNKDTVSVNTIGFGRTNN